MIALPIGGLQWTSRSLCNPSPKPEDLNRHIPNQRASVGHQESQRPIPLLRGIQQAGKGTDESVYQKTSVGWQESQGPISLPERLVWMDKGLSEFSAHQEDPGSLVGVQVSSFSTKRTMSRLMRAPVGPLPNWKNSSGSVRSPVIQQSPNWTYNMNRWHSPPVSLKSQHQYELKVGSQQYSQASPPRKSPGLTKLTT